MKRPTRAQSVLGALLTMSLGGCGDASPTGVDGLQVALELTGLPSLDTTALGPFQAWFVDEDGGLFAAERFASEDEGGFTVVVTSPIDDPAHVMVTLEPPLDEDPAPSELKLMGGRMVDGGAQLGVTGYLTPNIPLEPAPGVHVLGTFASFGPPGLPERQDAGLWLMDPAGDTLDGTYWQDFTPLTEGWMYEGWVVRDLGQAGEVWISYGKFRPDGFRQARFRDNSGLGPFSGKPDYERALPFEVRVPGDDWLANPMGLPVPGGVEMPLDLNGDPESGISSRWTHVISVEPYEDRFEDPWLAAPFFVRPYTNPIGESAPEVPRVIGFDAGGVPSGSALVVGGIL